MRALHLGANGNLGSRVNLPLLDHGHTVTAYVRENGKLTDVFGEETTNRITIVGGNALETACVARALREHSCDAVVNMAGTPTGIRHPGTGYAIQDYMPAFMTERHRCNEEDSGPGT